MLNIRYFWGLKTKLMTYSGTLFLFLWLLLLSTRVVALPTGCHPGVTPEEQMTDLSATGDGSLREAEELLQSCIDIIQTNTAEAEATLISLYHLPVVQDAPRLKARVSLYLVMAYRLMGDNSQAQQYNTRALALTATWYRAK